MSGTVVAPGQGSSLHIRVYTVRLAIRVPDVIYVLSILGAVQMK